MTVNIVDAVVGHETKLSKYKWKNNATQINVAPAVFSWYPGLWSVSGPTVTDWKSLLSFMLQVWSPADNQNVTSGCVSTKCFNFFTCILFCFSNRADRDRLKKSSVFLFRTAPLDKSAHFGLKAATVCVLKSGSGSCIYFESKWQKDAAYFSIFFFFLKNSCFDLKLCTINIWPG